MPYKMPLWIQELGCNKLKLSEHEYFKTIEKGFPREQIGFISKASRESNILMISLLNTVDMFMELVRMITDTKLNEVISIGDASSYSGAMQVVGEGHLDVSFKLCEMVVHSLFTYIIAYIIWVEHVEIPDLIVHNMSRSIISSGYAYGAKHLVSFMKKQCKHLACATDIANYPYIEDLNKIGSTDLSM
ncbi:hypothetical protein M9H77_19344 [Catharanthus roseus]|uniref:Uncharacterized protein n=1 Tax=Catharanthus roseus TaxID=4058 RepID=A0ACC0BA16_CATRO|nr:hypothetical protein M9H77_19344 [Catharanthus roseus]